MNFFRIIFTLSMFFFVGYIEALPSATDTIMHKELDEIIIKKELSRPDNSNRKTIYPKEIINLSGATAANILQHLPSVECDMEGNLRFRGSDKITVLINGRPSALTGDYKNEVFIQYPASAIDYIETEMVASAAQLSEGTAGIINIVLKNNNQNRNSGNLNLAVANGDRYNAGASYNMQKGIVTLFVQGAYKKEFRTRSFNNLTIANPGNESTRSETEQNNTATAHPQSILGNIDATFNFNRANQLGFNISFFQLDFNRTGNINNIIRQAGEAEKTAKIIRDNDQTNRSTGGYIYYIHKFKDQKNSLKIDFAYRKSIYDEKNNYDRNKKVFDNLLIDQNVNEYDATISHIINFNQDIKLESGYSDRLSASTNKNLKNDLKNGTWTEDADKSYLFELKQNTHALFSQFYFNNGSWNLSAGIRGEYSNRKTESNTQTTGNEHSGKDYFNFLPNASLKYNFSERNSLQLYYGRRINRPTYNQLNPYTDFSDPLHIRRGNPDLKVETSDNLSLGYTYRAPGVYIVPALFLRHMTNAITGSLYREGEKFIYIDENVNKNISCGLEINSTFKPFTWVNISLNGTVYYNEIDGRNLNFGIRKSDWAYILQGIVNFLLTPSTELQINGIYLSEMLTPQGSIKNRYHINTGIRQSLLKNKLTVSLSVEDWLNKAKETTIIDTPDLYKKTIKNRDNQVVWLGLSYNIN